MCGTLLNFPLKQLASDCRGQYEGLAGQTAYAASKGAICSMTLPMARDLARHNIRVVTLVPGPFATPLTGTTPFCSLLSIMLIAPLRAIRRENR